MAVSFDRIADRYDATRGGAIRGRVLAEAIHPWLRPTNVPAHPLVLEVCVGTGVVAAGLASFGFALCGVDISSRMAASSATLRHQIAVYAFSHHGANLPVE